MLRGIAHAHSTFSFDGKLELRTLQNLLTEAQIDFCLMSEHIETLDYEKISHMLAAYRALARDGCMMIPGIEIDDLHILIYGITAVKPYEEISDLARQMFDGGALIFVSHPIKVKKPLPPVILPWLTGVEIWNTRYDGRRVPRARNLQLWKQLTRECGTLQPLTGVDFHRASDLSGIRIEVDCPKEPRAVLDAIAAGRHSLTLDGRKIEIDSPPFTAAVWTGIFDLMVSANKRLRKSPVRIPGFLRRAGRKVL